MIQEKDLVDIKKLKAAITTTFTHRGTEYKVPIEFDASGMTTLQTLWTSHRNGLGKFKDKVPEQISTAMGEINTWLSTLK